MSELEYWEKRRRICLPQIPHGATLGANPGLCGEKPVTVCLTRAQKTFKHKKSITLHFEIQELLIIIFNIHKLIQYGY